MSAVCKELFWRNEELVTLLASHSGPLTGAATGTLVLLYVLGSGRCDLDALSMKPLFTYVTAYPELVVSIIVTACAA